jgi:hypothetical protein
MKNGVVIQEAYRSNGSYLFQHYIINAPYIKVASGDTLNIYVNSNNTGQTINSGGIDTFFTVTQALG